jgi:DNA-binding transcriptional LysR family regulator
VRTDEMRAFVVLADELSFHRAADRLHLSQPALSARLRRLEVELGVRLFDRDRSGTRLTVSGERLLPAVVEALQRLDDLLLAAGALRTTVARRELRVGLGPGALGMLTWPALRLLTGRRPDLGVVTSRESFRSVLPGVASGRLDVALVRGPVAPRRGREVATVHAVPVHAMMPRSHHVAQNGAVSLEDVVPFFAARPPAEMEQAFTDFWTRREHPAAGPLHVRLADEGHLRLQLAAAREGVVGLWPGDVSVSARTGLVTRPLTDDLSAPVQVVWRSGAQGGADLVDAARDAVASVRGLQRGRGPDHEERSGSVWRAGSSRP